MRVLRYLLFFGVALVASPLPAAAQSHPTTMKAVVVHEYGGPEVLKLESVPVPEPKDDEILVRVVVAGVNPVDGLIRSGKFAKYFKTKLPLTSGFDIAGTVEKAGAKVTKFKPGDAVYADIGSRGGGGYAEYALASEKEASAKPKSLNFIEAGAVPTAATTAWQALVRAAELKPGQTVLIHGASGGVGCFAIQIAKARGAKVLATASTANQDLLKELGADVAIDYTTTKFEDVARNVDVVLDSVGKDTLARSYGVVKKGGYIVSLVAAPKPIELEEHGIRGGPLNVEPRADDLAEITKLIEAKKIKVIIAQVLPLADAAKAQAQVETHHTRGKMVLRVAEDPK